MSLSRSFFHIAVILIATAPAFGQSNPAVLTLPVDQQWGVAGFTTPPAGFAAWGGLSGAGITSQALAESSTPTANASISSSTPANGGAGGCYGYAVSGDARFGILTSSNTSSGACQLAMAIDTTGQSNITLSYKLINAVANARTVGAVCQYRVGTGGAWTTLTGTGNPYVQSSGTVGDITLASLQLPPAAEGQAVVQIRWAVWRGGGAGNSSGFAIDNVSVSAANGSPLISGITLSGGPNYDLGETSTATVTLSAAPVTTATVNVASGAFATTPVVITAPDVSGSAEVTMSNAGTFTASATPISGAGGSATSASFDVIGLPTAAFASTGVNVIDDSSADGDGYIEPGENGVKLYFQITNNGTANATSILGTLTSMTPAVTVTSNVQNYPDLLIGANGTNALPFQIDVSPSHVCGTNINLQLAVTSNEGNSNINLTLGSCPPTNGLYDPPADYYLTATGTGATLKAQLHNIISKDYWNGFMSTTNHKVRSYDDARFALQVTDLDPNNSSNLILIYTGISVTKTWDAGSTWNREHQWPNARGLNDGGPDYSDLFNLRPCNPSLNSSRGDSPYGIGGGFFDPDHGAPVRGDVARSMFYMDTRYDGADANTVDLTLVNGFPSTNQMGDLAKMLEWHFADIVSESERRRNHTVFSNVANPSYYQGNRNPFIDHPEFVWTIWGSTANDSKIYLGGSPPPDGASSAPANLGTIIVNAPMPAPQIVALNKSGANPTTLNIVLAGSASSPDAGPRQAFIGGTQSRNISAGLSAPTTVAGLKSGTISIDNTDLTSAGAGQGSADGNDTITVSATVLDHANASFASPADQNNLTIDFGTVPLGTVLTQNVNIHNLTLTPGFTASLDLDSVNGSGDTARLFTDIAPFANLAAGNSHTFVASFDRSALGSFSATYTLTSSDEDLAGATAGANLVLTLTGNVIPSCTMGDLNLDTLVNGADVQGFLNCLSNINAANCTCGDYTGGGVTAADIPAFVADLLAP